MNSSLASKRIAFIGAGAMAEAIIQGLIEKQKAGPGHICVMNNQNKQRLHELQERYGVRTASEPSEKDKMVKESDIVVLTMKPNDVERSFAHLKALLHPGQQIVSVIAGLQIDKMQELFGQKLPIIRTMPNTSCTIGLGVTGMSFSREVTSGQKEAIIDMFQGVGIVSVVEENQLEIITGVSGSGPAYVYYFMEAMVNAGIEGGLPDDESRKLVLQTFLGAAKMVELKGEDPAVLRRKVTSPNGATEAAIAVLDRYQFSESIVKAVDRCGERARELGAQIAKTPLS